MFKIFWLSFVLCFCLGACHHSGKKAEQRPDFSQNLQNNLLLGKFIKNLHFFPINGLRFRLSDLKSTKAVVIVMRESGCPISEKYGPVLSDIEKKYSKKNIKFIYNYVGTLDRKNKAQSDLKKFNFQGSYVVDSKFQIADALNAQTTTEVFVLDATRRLVYRGPVNDQFHLLKTKINPKNHYLKQILNQIIKGETLDMKALPAPGCVISRPVIKDTVFYNDVAPIFKSKCVNCHNSSKENFIDLSTYEKIASRHAMIKYSLNNNLMPPWPLEASTGPWENDLSLSPYEKATLLKWLATGLKKDKKALDQEKHYPPSKNTTNGKEKIIQKLKSNQNIKKPDYVVKLPEPIKIKATGFMPLKKWTLLTPFKENKWIQAVEFVIKPKVVHHITFSVFDRDLTYGKKNLSCVKASSTCLIGGLGWALGGSKYRDLSDSIGIKIPKKSQLHLNIHYEPIGRKILDDITEIRFFFHKSPPAYQRLTLLLRNKRIKISPEEENYKSELIYKVKNNLVLHGVATHMHLRGQASSMFVIDKRGKSTRIFGLYPWNWNFQQSYIFKSPILIPKQSILKCINWFDNSSNNIVNPNPKKTVFYGLRANDEMSECYYGFYSSHIKKSDRIFLDFRLK